MDGGRCSTTLPPSGFEQNTWTVAVAPQHCLHPNSAPFNMKKHMEKWKTVANKNHGNGPHALIQMLKQQEQLRYSSERVVQPKVSRPETI